MANVSELPDVQPEDIFPGDDGDIYDTSGPSDEELEAQFMASSSSSPEDDLNRALFLLPKYATKWGLVDKNGKPKTDPDGKPLTYGLEREVSKLPADMDKKLANALTIIRDREHQTESKVEKAYDTIIKLKACAQAQEYLGDETTYALLMAPQLSEEDLDNYNLDDDDVIWLVSAFVKCPQLMHDMFKDYDRGVIPQVYTGSNYSSRTVIDRYVSGKTCEKYKELHGGINIRNKKQIDNLRQAIFLGIGYSYRYSGVLQNFLVTKSGKNPTYNYHAAFPTPSSLPYVAVVYIMKMSDMIRPVALAPTIVFPAIHCVDKSDMRSYGTYKPIIGGFSFKAETADAQKAKRMILRIESELSAADFDKISTELSTTGVPLKQCTEWYYVPFRNGLLDYRTKELIPWDDIVNGTKSELKDICFFYKLAVDYYPEDEEPEIPTDFTNLDGSQWMPRQIIDSLFDEESERNALWDVMSIMMHPYAGAGFVAFFCDGSDAKNGGNGKSTVYNTAAYLWGVDPNSPENTADGSPFGQADIYSFGDQFGLSACLTSYVIGSNENTEKEKTPDMAKLKSIATGEQISVDIKFHTPVDMYFHVFCLELFNSLPPMGSLSGSFDRRLLIFKFNKDFRHEKENRRITKEYIRDQRTLNWIGWFLIHKVGLRNYNVESNYFYEKYPFLKENFRFYKTETDPVSEFLNDMLYPEETNELYPYHLRSEVWLPRQLYEIFKHWYEYKHNARTRMSESEFKDRLDKGIAASKDWEWYKAGHDGGSIRWSAKKWLFGIYEPAIRKFQVVELMQCSSFHGNVRDYQALTPLMQINLADTSGQAPLNGKGTYTGKNFIYKVKDETDKKALEDSIIEIRKDYDQLDSATGQLAPQPATGLDYNGAWNDMRFHAIAIRTDELLKHFTPEQLAQMAEDGQVLLTPPVPYAEMPIIANSTTIKAALALHKEKVPEENRKIKD